MFIFLCSHKHGLSKSRKGNIVHHHSNGQRFNVELVRDAGEVLALLTLERSDIQPERETLREQVLAILNSLPEDLIAEVRDFAEFLQRRKAGSILRRRFNKYKLIPKVYP
ncbi:MAG: DUF4926 domain-containing protein [Oculatellaceae cyanobacterium bins.114]|nr:DUF4926 domain-containing protein [Oculatellaceae cyanobacterium bins.114]